MSSLNVTLSTLYHIFTTPQKRTASFEPPEDMKEMQQDYDRLIHALLIDCEMFNTFLRTIRHIFQLDDTDGKNSYRELPILTKGLKISETIKVMSVNDFFTAFQEIDKEMKGTMLSLLTTTGEDLELIRYDMRAFMSLYSFMEKLNDLDNYLSYRVVESDIPVITEVYNIIRVKFPESALKDALLKYFRVYKQERIQVVEYLVS